MPAHGSSVDAGSGMETPLKEEEQRASETEREAGEKELSYSCSVGSALENKNTGWRSEAKPTGRGERRRSLCEGAWQQNKEVTRRSV